MAQKITIVSTVTGTGTTTDLTETDFGTIDGAIIILSGNTTSDTDNGHAQRSITFWDGTNQFCEAFLDRNALATSDTYSRMSATNLELFHTDGTIDCYGTLSNITDGVRISWNTGDEPSSSYKIDAILLGGGIGVDVGSVVCATALNGTASFTGARATPDAVLTIGGWSSSIDTTINGGRVSQGVAVNDGSRTQAMTQILAVDASAVGNYGTAGYDGYFSGRVGSTANMQELTAFNSDGFTTTTRVSSSGAYYTGVMCLSGLGDVALLGHLNHSSTGSTSMTGAGFQPDFLYLLYNDHWGAYTTAQNNGIGVGFADGTNEATLSMFGDDGSGTTDTGQRHSTGHILDSWQTEGDTAAIEFTSFDSDGYTANVSTAGAQSNRSLLLELSPDPAWQLVDDSGNSIVTEQNELIAIVDAKFGFVGGYAFYQDTDKVGLLGGNVIAPIDGITEAPEAPPAPAEGNLWMAWF